jgi:hypothetical protein
MGEYWQQYPDLMCRQPCDELKCPGLGAVRKVGRDGVWDPVLQRGFEQRHARVVVTLSLIAGARVAAELDGLPERLLGPSDSCSVDGRHRRKVSGLWLGLHRPSLVAVAA